MGHDQYGRPVAVGDTVVIKGEVIHVLDDPNFINCTVKLAQQMPPSGAETTVQCNTAQLEKQGGGAKKPPSPPMHEPVKPPTEPAPPTATHPKK